MTVCLFNLLTAQMTVCLFDLLTARMTVCMQFDSLTNHGPALPRMAFCRTRPYARLATCIHVFCLAPSFMTKKLFETLFETWAINVTIAKTNVSFILI